MRNITSLKTDAIFMLIVGLVVLAIGTDALLHSYLKLGGTFVFLGLVNLFNSWRTIRRLENQPN